jgi:predicted amidohydrolase
MTAARKLRVASVQMEHRDGDRDANFAKIERFVAEAAAQGAQLVVLPECCVCGYWFIRNLSVDELTALAEPIPEGPSTQRLRELAQRHRITVGADGLKARRAAASTTHTSSRFPMGRSTVIASCSRSSMRRSAAAIATPYSIFRKASGPES